MTNRKSDQDQEPGGCKGSGESAGKVLGDSLGEVVKQNMRESLGDSSHAPLPRGGGSSLKLRLLFGVCLPCSAEVQSRGTMSW